MITFHLGVIDVPYEDENTTTGDVAEYLEEKYQIMQTFFDRYSNDIADLMANDLAASLENMMAGAPPAKDPLAEYIPAIQKQKRATAPVIHRYRNLSGRDARLGERGAKCLPWMSCSKLQKPSLTPR